MRGMFKESAELKQFLDLVEYTKYSLLSVPYIEDNKETVLNSIHGKYVESDMILNGVVFDPSQRAYSLKDISWSNVYGTRDLISIIVKRCAFARIFNLKTQYEQYARSIGKDNKKLGEDLRSLCPSFRIILPSRKDKHITDIVNSLRNALIHANVPNSKEHSEFVEDMGDLDPEQLLM